MPAREFISTLTWLFDAVHSSPITESRHLPMYYHVIHNIKTDGVAADWHDLDTFNLEESPTGLGILIPERPVVQTYSGALMVPIHQAIAFGAAQNRWIASWKAESCDKASADERNEIMPLRKLLDDFLVWAVMMQKEMTLSSYHPSLCLWWALACHGLPFTRKTLTSVDAQVNTWDAEWANPMEVLQKDWKQGLSPAALEGNRSFPMPLSESENICHWYYEKEDKSDGRSMTRRQCKVLRRIGIQPDPHTMKVMGSINSAYWSVETWDYLADPLKFFNAELVDAYLDMLDREYKSIRGRFDGCARWSVDRTDGDRLRREKDLPPDPWISVLAVEDDKFVAVTIDKKKIKAYPDLRWPLAHVQAEVARTISELTGKEIPAEEVMCERDAWGPPPTVADDASGLWAAHRVRAVLFSHEMLLRRSMLQAGRWASFFEISADVLRCPPGENM